MEEQGKHKIDDFFKQAFDEASSNPEEALWNVPSEEVWEQIELATQPKDRPLVVYWKWGALAASLLLLLTLSVHAIYQKTKLNQQASKIEHIEKQLHELQEQTTGVIKIDSVTNTPQAEIAYETIIDTPSSSTTAQGIAANKNHRSYSNVEKIKISHTATNGRANENSPAPEHPLKSSPIVLSIDSSLLLEDAAQENLLAHTNKESTKALQAINTLSVKQIHLLDTKDWSAQPLTNKSVAASKEKALPWLTFFVAPLESIQRFERRRRGFFQNDLITENAGSIGLQVSYPINEHWFLETGVHYTRSTAKRLHSSNIRYRKRGEYLNDQGALENQYNLEVFTSEGIIETDIVIARATSSSEPAEGAAFNLELQSKLLLQQVQLPFSVGYQVQHNRWLWSAKVGVLGIAKQADKIAISAARSDDSRFEVRNIKRPNTRPWQQKQGLEWQFHASTTLAYQFNENWAVQLEPYFSRGSQSRPIRHPRLMNSSIFNQSAGVRLGVRYLL